MANKFYDNAIKLCLYLEEIPKNHELNADEKWAILCAETKLKEWAELIDRECSGRKLIAGEIKKMQETCKEIEESKFMKKGFLGQFFGF